MSLDEILAAILGVAVLLLLAVVVLAVREVLADRQETALLRDYEERQRRRDDR